MTEALDQQTATSEILRVISSSPTDVQPVFDAIVGSTVSFCDGLFCVAYRFDGQMVDVAAHHNLTPEAPEGGRIEVAAMPRDGFVEVSVSDTGVGIAAEDQEAVFEEFRRVGASTAKQEGTGLGLALCHKFVELHGGKIGVTSEVGVGSTFTFTIPVRGGGQ